MCKAVGLVRSEQTTTPEEERWYDDAALLILVEYSEYHFVNIFKYM